MTVYMRIMWLETKIWIGMCGRRSTTRLKCVLWVIKDTIFFVVSMLSDPYVQIFQKPVSKGVLPMNVCCTTLLNTLLLPSFALSSYCLEACPVTSWNDQTTFFRRHLVSVLQFKSEMGTLFWDCLLKNWTKHTQMRGQSRCFAFGPSVWYKTKSTVTKTTTHVLAAWGGVINTPACRSHSGSTGSTPHCVCLLLWLGEEKQLLPSPG